ncbi:MAG: RhuM family protein [Acidithiobacillus sp.]
MACQDGQGASRRDRELAMHYNLDVIISVGYRVKSLRGTPFRIWATQQLHSYMVKGFALAADTWRGAVLLR